jgi:predicted molibdopterin-dependent oxidoreductase YjgC
MPTEANVNGALDMGVSPDAGGRDFHSIIDGALDGSIKALVVAGDNPMLLTPNRPRVEQALAKLDCLIVIDQVPSETAQRAHVALAAAPAYSTSGTSTNADRRVQRLRPAMSVPGDARPGWQIIAELAAKLASGGEAKFDYATPDEVTNEIAEKLPLYASFRADRLVDWSHGRAVDRDNAGPVAFQAVEQRAAVPVDGQLTLLTGRTLYTSLEGAAIRSPDADKLHREEGVFLNQYDARDRQLQEGDVVVLRRESAEVTTAVRLTNAIPRGMAFVPLYYDGGIVNTLLPSENGSMALPRVTIAKQGSPGNEQAAASNPAPAAGPA